jgi:hypothetical protein
MKLPTWLHVPAGLRKFDKQRPGLLPVVGVGAGLVAAYAGLAALRRSGAAPVKGAVPTPSADLSALGGLGLDSGFPVSPLGTSGAPVPGFTPGGGGYDPIPTPVNVGISPPWGAGGIMIGGPPPPTVDPGGSRGLPAPTRQGTPPSSPILTLPGIPTPVGMRPPEPTPTVVSFGGWGSPAAQAAHHHTTPPRTLPAPSPVLFGGWGSAAAQAAHAHALGHSHSAAVAVHDTPLPQLPRPVTGTKL